MTPPSVGRLGIFEQDVAVYQVDVAAHTDVQVGSIHIQHSVVVAAVVVGSAPLNRGAAAESEFIRQLPPDEVEVQVGNVDRVLRGHVEHLVIQRLAVDPVATCLHLGS